MAYAALVQQQQQPQEQEPDTLDGDAYMSSSSSSLTTPIVMAHDVPSSSPSSHVLHEVDLRGVLVDTELLGLFSDDRTYGCSLMTSAGTMVRVECKDATHVAEQQQEQEQLLEHDLSQHIVARDLSSPSRKVASLLNHLRSTFWESYQYPDRAITLPPSIARAEKSDLERAIVKLGLELQKDAAGSSASTSLALSNSVLPRHLAFLEFLQQASIYRGLMLLTKWHLMAIGQEIAAFQAVVSCAASTMSSSSSNAARVYTTGRMESFLESLTPYGMAVWLEGVQSAVILQNQGSEDEQELFGTWLEHALSASLNYRKDRCTLVYDIATTAKPPRVEGSASVAIWTSKPMLQRVLHRQLTFWNDRNAECSPTQLEVVVTAALRSYCDSYLSTPCETTKVSYAKNQYLAINLLRKMSGRQDALAWSLSKEHAYFWGLCQIAHEHRNDGGACQQRGSTVNTATAPTTADDFSLAPLFTRFGQVSDMGTGMSFGKYVIKWHIERNLFGEALKLGNTHCQADLLVMINSEPSLRPYRWIVSMQRGDLDSASNNLIEVVERRGAGMNLTLKQAKFNLAMAKLANKVVLQKSVPGNKREMVKQRGEAIENMRELAHAQEQLLDEEDARNRGYHWSAESLLEYAMEKVDRLDKDDRDGKAKTCFTALAVCASLDNSAPEVKKTAAANVWYKALMADWDLLDQILRGGGDSWWSSDRYSGDGGMVREMLQQSVFGKLVEECDKISSLEHVSIDTVMERFIVEKLVGNGQLSERSSIHRLLRSVLSLPPKN